MNDRNPRRRILSEVQSPLARPPQGRNRCLTSFSSSGTPAFVSFCLLLLWFLPDPWCRSCVGVEGWIITGTSSRRYIQRSSDHTKRSLYMAPRKKNENASGAASQISPDLMDFFSKKGTSTENEPTTRVIPSADVATPSFVPFATADAKVDTADFDSDQPLEITVASLIQQLEAIVSAAGPSLMQNIVPCIQQFSLLQQQSALRSSNPRGRGGKSGLGKSGSSSSSDCLSYRRIQEEQASRENDDFHYRLLWVGSDAAMSSLGTGLHKVPLARLQEVFLSLSVLPAKKNKLSKFRITCTEVIRILGPFPNVKNTLQGTCTMSANVTGAEYREQWNILWESMIDGTGKELINATSNQRSVPLSIVYGDSQVLIAATGPEMESESIFVFLRDTEMEVKLAALRVL